MVKSANVRAHNLIFGMQEIGAEHGTDAVAQQRVVVDGLVLGLGHLQHQRPVWARLSGGAGGSRSVGKPDGRQLDVVCRLVVG